MSPAEGGLGLCRWALSVLNRRKARSRSMLEGNAKPGLEPVSSLCCSACVVADGFSFAVVG